MNQIPALQGLSQEVASYLGLDLGAIRIKRFADGEIYVQVQESIRGCDVFLIQPTCPTHDATVNDMLMELMVMIDACRCAACSRTCCRHRRLHVAPVPLACCLCSPALPLPHRRFASSSLGLGEEQSDCKLWR